MTNMKILVTGAGGPAGINVIRSLAKKHYVIAADANPMSEGFLFAQNYTTIPYAWEENFINKLINLSISLKVDMIIPTVDEELPKLSLNKDRFNCEVITHPYETLEIVLDKYKTYSFLVENMADIVPQFALRSDQIDSEVVVKKPRRGRGSRNIKIMSKVSSKEENAKEDYFYVEFLPGREWTVDILTNRNGELIVAVPRIRVKTRGGISVIGFVKMDKEILKLSRKITELLLFTGPLNIQFKEDKKGQPKLLEINPRFSGGLDISIAAGADLPKILVEIWKDPYYAFSPRIREGIYVKVWHTYPLSKDYVST